MHPLGGSLGWTFANILFSFHSFAHHFEVERPSMNGQICPAELSALLPVSLVLRKTDCQLIIIYPGLKSCDRHLLPPADSQIILKHV